METILVNCSRKSNQIQVNIGYAVLMNSLKLNDIRRRLIDLVPVDPPERMSYLKSHLSGERAIYAFGITIGNGQILEVEECAKIIKKADQENIIVYGGPLASSSPKILLEHCLCDYALTGEAENTFPELLRRLLRGEKYPDVNEIPGLYYRRNGEIKGRIHKKIGQLAESSNPDFSEFDMDFYVGYLKETGQSWEIMASRGCVGVCSFCYKMVGSGISIRSIDDVLGEIEMVIKNYGLNKFYFVDDNLLLIKDWYQSFLRRRKERGLDFSFVVQARIDSITEEAVREGVKNGLVCVSVGVEVVSQSALDKIRKRITIEQVKEKIALLDSYGVAFSANFIIGFDWETEDDYRQMFDFIKDNNLASRAKLSYLTPLPNTLIYRQAKERDLIGDEYEYILEMGDLYWELILNLTSMPDETLRYWYDKISDMAHRKIVFPTSEKYLNKLADHHYRRIKEEKRLCIGRK